MNQHPESIGPYQIIEPLGKGGMGVVYHARHKDTGAQVALKTVRFMNEATLRSIRREIHVLAKINHPGIIRILDHGTVEGLPWYAMELLQGETLHSYIANIWGGSEKLHNCETSDLPDNRTETSSRWWTLTLSEFDSEELLLDETIPVSEQDEGATPPFSQPSTRNTKDEEVDIRKVFTLFQKLCEPLAYLHGEGIVHRDLKPDNIFIRRNGQPVIVDFGLLMQFRGGLSRETLRVEQYSSGTVSYMAPEQIRGEFVDARADIYSLGCILFEIITGRPPFFDNDVVEIMNGHLFRNPRSISHVAKNIPAEFDAFMSQLLAKDLNNRIGYADSVAAHLSRFGGEHQSVPEELKPRLYLYRAGFAGRTEGQRLLNEKLEHVHEGKGGIILISGETGIGKTRMIMEFGQQAGRENVLILTGECSAEGSRPFEAFRKPLLMIADRCRVRGKAYTDRIIGNRGNVLSLYEPSIKSLPGQESLSFADELPVSVARKRLFSYLFYTLKQLSDEQPVLLIIDDIHRGDDLHLQFLEFLTRVFHVEETRFLVIATCLEGTLSTFQQNLTKSPEAMVVILDQLEENDIQDMLCDMLAIQTPPTSLLLMLNQQAGGNPLFVVEFVHFAVEIGLLVRDESGKWCTKEKTLKSRIKPEAAQSHSPRSIEDLFTIRMQKLSVSAQSVLKAGAILGKRIHVPLLEYVTEIDEPRFIDAMEELTRKHLLIMIAPDTFRLPLGIMQMAIYNQIDEEERRVLHRKAALGIETLIKEQDDEYLYSLGKQWELAGNKLRACEAHYNAGTMAFELYAYEEAAHFFQRYLKLIDTVTPESITIRKKLGQDILVTLGQSQMALTCMKQAISEAQSIDDSDLSTECICALGKLFWRIGEMEQAKKHIEDALSKSRSSGNQQLEAHVLINLATITYILGSPDEALNQLSDALKIALDIHDTSSRAKILGNMGLINCEIGNMAEAREHFDKSLELNATIGNRVERAKILSNLAILQREQGELKEAQQNLQEALTIYREIGNIIEEAISLNNLAGLYFDRGNEKKALELCQEALALHRSYDNKRYEGISLHSIACIYYEQEQYDEARAFVEQALALSRDIGDQRLTGWICLTLAHILLDQGNLKSADTFFKEAFTLREQVRDLRFKGSLLSFQAKYFRLVFDDLERAQKCAEEAQKLYQETQNPFDQISAICNLGHIALARHESAEPFINECYQIYDQFSADMINDTAPAREIKNIERAQAAFDRAEKHLLFRGDLIKEIPEKLRMKLLSSDSSE